MKGLIFDIKRFAVHDGPGIRTTVFLKGCPLKCWWCHNPESHNYCSESILKTEMVNGKAFQSVHEVGTYYSVNELMKILKRELVFMEESNGGVSFSGGEPLLQIGFLKEALKACKNEFMHTAVDTSGFAEQKAFDEIIPYTDLFLFDLKHLDSTLHKKYTGQGNEKILSNLLYLIKLKKDIWLRIPIVPGINDSNTQLEELHSFLKRLENTSIKQVNFLPYHKTGSSKYKRFQMENNGATIPSPSEQFLNDLIQKYSTLNFKFSIGG